MKKIYISLLLLIGLFAFIFFVIDINFSGNVNNYDNTETKKDINYIDNNYLINLDDVSLKYDVKLKNNCFDLFKSLS